MEKIEILAWANHGPSAYAIYDIDGRHYILQPKADDCRTTLCYYHLVQLRNGVPAETFTFRGNGTIWIIGSPANFRFEGLDDRHSVVGFETANNTFVEVALPLERDTIVAQPLVTADAGRLRCPVDR